MGSSSNTRVDAAPFSDVSASPMSGMSYNSATDMPSNPMTGIMAMQGGASLLGAYSGYQAGRSNAATLRMNAALRRTQASQVQSSAEFQAGLMDLKEAHLRGAQESSYATQGVVVGAGTAGQVVRAGEAMSEADKSMIRLNAARQAYGLEVAAASEDFQADMTKKAANMNAIGSLISGAGNIAFTAAML